MGRCWAPCWRGETKRSTCRWRRFRLGCRRRRSRRKTNGLMGGRSTYGLWGGVSGDGVRAGKVVGGASTIPQQLVRLRYQTPRTWWGKLTTVWLAWRVQAGSTPDEILNAYLNHVPMGGNLYGVEAAARHYFGCRR
ncbi:MAG: transglycosylase domain-containing protein, partial [Oscillatoriales cyanobacterium SM2_1_8]|nr:transglycosylase domain-containing protein [Oscillatoriales cyanobacterium SM2_1_8]